MNPTPDNSQPSTRIRVLVHRSLDESLPASEVREIEAALQSSPAMRRWYADVIQLHAELAATGEAREACHRVLEEFRNDQSLSESQSHLVCRAPRRWRRFSPISIAASLLVISLGIGCGMGLLAATLIHVRPSFTPLPWNWKVDNDVVAKITSTSQVAWQPSETPETPPTLGVRVGQHIRLASGQLQLVFRSGVNVMIIGPAVFEVRSETGGKLYSGRLSATASANSSPFHVETPVGRFQFGAGHYGIEVDNQRGYPASRLHAISGIAAGDDAARFVSTTGSEFNILAGQTFECTATGKTSVVPLADGGSFAPTMPPARREVFTGDTIFLGHLFDDCKSSSLTEATQTDTYQAAGETIDLGVAAVHDGGLDVDVQLAEDGVLFNLLNVGGGGPKVVGLPANATFRSTSTVPIRTTGCDFGAPKPLPRIEEGIGMCANELLTFDLDELRRAGQLGSRAMRFVVDRAGINDREDPLEGSRNMASVRMIVIVSTPTEVIAGFVDGQQMDVFERGGVFSFDLASNELSQELRYDGRFVSFDVPIPLEARFLTLATTMLTDEHHDHAVFSGARLELSESQRSAVKTTREVRSSR